MKRAPILIVLAVLAFAASAQTNTYHYHAPKASTHHAPKTYTPRSTTVPVSGYLRSNGTYVMPSHRTSPNSTRLDNWSSKPNVNPYTGKQGTKDPYAPASSGG
jgi:hypothetical protein